MEKGEVERIPAERVARAIVLVRGQRVLLDRDLAVLYGVETRVLNQAVRRNIVRFPPDFLFMLTREEIRDISQIGRTEERQGRIEVYDTQSNRIGEGVRQPDGSIDFRDPQGNRTGRTGTPNTDGSVTFEDASSIC